MKTVLPLLLILAACETPARPNAGGDPVRGAEVLASRGCGACHTIPGIRGARGQLAAPLTAFSRRTYLIGEMPNTPQNVVDWIMHPRAIRPKTAMPDLGINATDARDAAAYLYSLD